MLAVKADIYVHLYVHVFMLTITIPIRENYEHKVIIQVNHTLCLHLFQHPLGGSFVGGGEEVELDITFWIRAPFKFASAFICVAVTFS